MPRQPSKLSIFASLAALLMAGFFAAFLGIIMLPLLLLFKRQSPPVAKTETPPPASPVHKNDNVIEADFRRVDKTSPEERLD